MEEQPNQEEETNPLALRKLSIKELTVYKERMFEKDYYKRKGSVRKLAENLRINHKTAKKLSARMRNGHLATIRPLVGIIRRSTAKVGYNHIAFLEEFLSSPQNVGKSFKEAWADLCVHYPNICVKRHSGYKAFKKLSDFSYKRIRRVKLVSNTLKNKKKR